MHDYVILLLYICPYTELAELQTFIDVAYTSANIADDELNIQKLNALRFVGNSVANFIPLFKSQAGMQSHGWRLM